MPVNPASDQLVAGRYAWKEQLGRGGFGVVWRAHDTLLQRDVAVKAIEFPPILDDAERAAIRKKVLREARAAARLNHPGLVTVFDVIEEDGRPLIVMELVAAPTLAELVARDGPMPDDRVAALGMGILEALEVAHAQGIIHRDVKPANVMVSASDRVQLTDFGIASVLDDPKVTASGTLAGSPSYMAPEQARNDTPSAATDLWGLGATLYFALEGEPPFRKDGAIATLTAVVNEPPRPLRRDTALAALVDDLLVKDPAARPSTTAVRRRLDEAIATAGVDPPVEAPVEAPVDPTTTLELGSPPASPTDPAATVPVAEAKGSPTTRPPAPPAAPPPRRRPVRPADVGSGKHSWRTALIVVGVLLVAVVVAAITLGSHGGSSSSTASKSPSGSAAPPTSARKSSSAAARSNASAPKGWVSYRDAATGYSITHPPGWTVSTNGTTTDFRDPASGAYLRVDHREPPGPSPEGAWHDLEPSFAAQNPGYHRIQITPTTYQGFRAAVWEYTYSGRGADLHAVDLGFVTPGHGFALNFQTSVADWDRMQATFDGFKAAFKAPST
jgi:serine/threonine protein kinase